ncbi:excinuclease ABC subunit UvrC [Candidatus Poribacteria bacterium]|nr:excinuclease ABC subunit UvrC [Candidatus Poribacteria bacterium]
MNSIVEKKLESLPSKPGVYLMKDQDGKVLYVGKASSLSRRVRDYFGPNARLHAMTPNLIPRVKDIDYIITDNEVEALILESNLVKKYNPRYNVRLKDDKRYPYLKVTSEDFPRISMTRIVENDGSKYYGPYVHAKATRQTLKEITKAFPIRTCDLNIEEGKTDNRPCLDFHIGRCLAPCAGMVDKEEYQEVCQSVGAFLKGDSRPVIRKLMDKMNQAAADLNFERAAHFRDRIENIEKILQKQNVTSSRGEDQDVIGFYRKDDEACVQILMVRGGKLLDKEHFFMNGTEESSSTDIITAFITQYYHDASFVPKTIILQDSPEMPEVITKWLSEKRGSNVELHVPQKGRKLSMVEMASKNAKSILERDKQQKVFKQDDNPALIALKDILSLPTQPHRIDAFDISNMGGNMAVGSMVVFIDGKPEKSEYRRFRIKTVKGQDDFAMMREVITRRFRGALEEDKPLPDLLLVDGGKGQLNAALIALRDVEIEESQPIIGLAKKFEEIYLPGQSEPIILSDRDPALHLIQRIRDEAHRFAIAYHHKLMEKTMSVSILDYIPNIGPKRKQMLMQYFGSIENMQGASIDDLRSVKGITQKIAEDIKKYLSSNSG